MWLSIKRTLVFCAVSVLFAGCAGGGSPFSPNANPANVDLSRTLLTPRVVNPAPRNVPSVYRIRPNCCAYSKTLFVTDAFGGSSFTGAVYAFDYPSGTLLGTLPAPPEGWSEVQGACVDKSGNAYFANTALSTIDEYSHSGTFIATLSDPNQFPVSCAFDRSTGNLAVSNIIDTSGGPGSITIYNAGVLQNTYYPPNMSRVYSSGYEAGTGTLWLSGSNSGSLSVFDTFAGGVFTPFTIQGGSFQVGGGFQWSALTKSMNAGGATGSNQTALLHVSPSMKVVGATVLHCGRSFCPVVEYFIKGPRVTIIDARDLDVLMFDYPAGGHPIKKIAGAPFVQPIGVVVSPNVP